MGLDQMMEQAALAAPGGAKRNRKRYIGVRQRPSGRRVAEIKDTIQKIGVWLGTYDTAEAASRKPKFFNVPKDCTFYENSDTLTNSTSGVTNSDNITESFESSSIGVEKGWVRVLDMDDNWTKVDDGKSTQGGEKLEEVGEKEDFDMGHIDFRFVDAVGSACYYSPFEIAEEMVEPVEQENHGNEPSLLGETMKRMKYERKFSASLYAFKWIPECLRLKQSEVANGPEKSEQLSNLGSNCNSNDDKMDREEFFWEVVKEQIGIPQASTEIGSSSSSSSPSSFFSTESGEPCLWSSLSLPPICSIADRMVL
ncbi:ethylene-responsive transcription factor ERN1-like [Fagus crenata]